MRYIFSCATPHPPFRVNNCRFAIGFESANLRKNPSTSTTQVCAMLADRVFERGDFAPVPFASARAIIEVERTISSRSDLIKQLGERRSLAPRGSLLGVVVNDSTPLLNRECTPDWLAQEESEPAITLLLDDKLQPDTKGVLAFIYFLAQLAGHNETLVQ